MKKLILLFGVVIATMTVYADTPPPGTVKAKMYTGDGVTGLTATGTALNVNVTNSGGLSTVDQGNAGTDPWVVEITNASVPVTGTFWQATQPVSGTLTCNAGSGTQAVSLASLPALATGANTIGAVNINGTVPISGTITATNTANGNPGSTAPSQATQSGGVDSGGNLRSFKVSSAGVLSVDGSASTQPVSGTFWQATQPVSGSFWQATQPVSGTFWQATQPISALSLPLPADASTETTLAALSGKVPSGLTVSSNRLLTDGSGVTQPVSGTFWQATQPVSGTVTANAGSGTFAVSGTFWQATQPVSGTVTANIGTSGALATAAKQPALGTAGTASSDVLTVQGITSMTPLLVNGSGSTQPVSGTVTANAGTGTFNVDASGHTVPVSGTFWQATQPVSGTVTANAGSGTFTVDASGFTVPVSGTFWQATQPVSLLTLPALTTGSAIIGRVGIDQTTPGTTNLVALAANQSVNQSQVAGTAVSVSNGTVDSGTQRVAIASNNTAFSVNATPVVPAAVTVKQAAITIGTSAVRLTTDGSAPSSTRVLLVAQLLSTSTANCYFGSSGVTSSSTGRGVQMFAGQSFSFNKDAGDYYAICDTTAQTFFITEQE